MKPSISCLTLRNFERHGGGSIRISGILNALAEQDFKIDLFCLSDHVPYLNDQINIIPLPNELAQLNKRKFQFALSIFPIKIVNRLFSKELNSLRTFFSKYPLKSTPIFFEYLDNSIAYWLQQNKIITGYINDIHGIVPIEFDENSGKDFLTKALFKLKKFSGIQLDKKTVNNAKAILYPSESVKKYFEDNVYSAVSKVEGIVVDEAINELLIEQQVNLDQVERIKNERKIEPNNQIIMFIGDFKPFGGVEDLFDAFKLLITKYNVENIKLILIGDGQLYSHLQKRVDQENLHQNIEFWGRIPYAQLRNYQEIADILVCPDRDTLYSQYLPHIKYYDSISSGKIVVHGKFNFSNELNPNEKFSIDFTPSDVSSLAKRLNFSLQNFDNLSEKYRQSSKIAKKRYTYKNSVLPLIKYLIDEN